MVQQHRPLDESICPACSKPIYPGANVVFRRDNMFHIACDPGVVTVADAVQGFLQKNRDHAYCHVCLASALRRTSDEVEKASGELRLTGRFLVTLGTCSGCQRERVTTIRA